MDIQNAIDYFKAYIDFCKQSGMDAPTLEPYEIAIEAMEKQTPHGLYYEADGYADGELVYDMANCPECGHRFEYQINDWGSNYCPNCGLKLDWGD